MQIKIIDHANKLHELLEKKELNGLFRIPDDIYYSNDCPGISQSMLKQMRISPKWFKLQQLSESSDSEAKRFGKMFHAAMEDMDMFLNNYKIAPDFKGPRGGMLKGDKLLEAVASWEIENGCKAITEKELKQIKMMQKSLMRNPAYSSAFKNPLREIAIFATDPRTGVLLKGKADLIQFSDDQGFVTIGDYKTCQARSIASNHQIMRKLLDEDYKPYYQYGFYRHLFACLNIISDFVFLFIEKEIPFGSRAVSLEDDFYNYAIDQIREDLEQYAESTVEDWWPCYDCKTTIKFPNYLKG